MVCGLVQMAESATAITINVAMSLGLIVPKMALIVLSRDRCRRGSEGTILRPSLPASPPLRCSARTPVVCHADPVKMSGYCRKPITRPSLSSQTRILSGRSMATSGAASITGVPPFGLPKIRRFVGRIFIPTFSASPLWSTEQTA